MADSRPNSAAYVEALRILTRPAVIKTLFGLGLLLYASVKELQWRWRLRWEWWATHSHPIRHGRPQRPVPSRRR
jgi:hypothetical protein